MKKIIFYAILSTIFLLKPVFCHEFVATIKSIHDGDTLTALVHDEKTKIRLLNVDCFETAKNSRATFQSKYYGLSYEEIFNRGKQSRKKLKKLLKDHRYIRVNWEKRDSFGRILGRVYLDDLKSAGNIEVNRYMLETGGCNKYINKK